MTMAGSDAGAGSDLPHAEMTSTAPTTARWPKKRFLGSSFDKLRTTLSGVEGSAWPQALLSVTKLSSLVNTALTVPWEAQMRESNPHRAVRVHRRRIPP